jgi:hypothetical protein
LKTLKGFSLPPFLEEKAAEFIIKSPETYCIQYVSRKIWRFYNLRQLYFYFPEITAARGSLFSPIIFGF